MENIKQFWRLESYIGVRIKGKIMSLSENSVLTLDVLSHGAHGLSLLSQWSPQESCLFRYVPKDFGFFLLRDAIEGAMRLNHKTLRSLYALLKTLLWPLCLQSSWLRLLLPMSLCVLLARMIAYFIKFVWTTLSQNVSLMWRMVLLS